MHTNRNYNFYVYESDMVSQSQTKDYWQVILCKRTGSVAGQVSGHPSHLDWCLATPKIAPIGQSNCHSHKHMVMKPSSVKLFSDLKEKTFPKSLKNYVRHMTTSRLLWKIFVAPAPKVSKQTSDTLGHNQDWKVKVTLFLTNWPFTPLSVSGGFQKKSVRCL